MLNKKQIVAALRDDSTGTPGMIYESGEVNWGSGYVTERMMLRLQEAHIIAYHPLEHVYMRYDIVAAQNNEINRVLERR